jgi:hypothetical protein
MWKILRPPKHKPPVAAEKIDKEYKRLRLQVFIGIFIGYAGYYLVRKNFTLAMPHLVEMGFDKGDLGIALSANAIAYGLSKFLMQQRPCLPAAGTGVVGAGDDVPRDIGRYLVDHHDVHHAVPHRLVPGYGLAPVRTRHDPLVLAERTRHEDVDLERGPQRRRRHDRPDGGLRTVVVRVVADRYVLVPRRGGHRGRDACIPADPRHAPVDRAPAHREIPQRLPEKLQREVGAGAYDEGNLLQIRTQQQDTLVYRLRQCVRVPGALRRTGLGADLPEGHQGL